MGPSGSGKTSLLSVLGLLDSDWQGEYRFDQQALHTMKDTQRKAFARVHLAFVFHHYPLLDDLTVAEDLDLPLSYRDIPASERTVRVADRMTRCGRCAQNARKISTA